MNTPTWTPITDVDEARRIAREWQSSGSVGSVLASFASGRKVDRWRLHDDARATQHQSPGMPLSDWADLDRLRDWAKVADDPLLTGPAGNIRVITNHHRLPEVDGWETTPEERERLDYVDWAAIERGEGTFTGVRYRGWLYDLGDMEGPPSGQLGEQGWTSYVSDSFFSGVVFRQVEVDHEWVVIVGRYVA